MDGSGVFGREKSAESGPDLVDKAEPLGRQAETPTATSDLPAADLPAPGVPSAANDDQLPAAGQMADECQN